MLCYTGFRYFLGCLGLFPCFLKIKCTNEIVNDLDVTNLYAWFVFVGRVDIRNVNLLDELPQNTCVKLGHIGVFFDRSNEMFDVNFLLLLLLHVLTQIFHHRL